MEAVLDEDGKQLTVLVNFPGGELVTVAVWVANVGRVRLLLLDTDNEANSEAARRVTDRLYGGDAEHRIKQELILGVGGARAVNAYCAAMGLELPTVAHLNEGHAGFLALERIRERMAEGLSFQSALNQVRAANIFTTHTPVPAGIDRFDMALVRHYFGFGLPEEQQLCPGVPLDEAIKLGRESDPSKFNMAHLGLRSSQRANGVAKLHGEVSREMFAELYPGYAPEEVPIGHVTNGVHLDTWVKPEMKQLIDKVAEGADLITAATWSNPDAVTDEQLWAARNQLRSDLIDTARANTHQSWLHRGLDCARLAWTQRVLDKDTLTIGFARRVSTYKRLTLVLQDPERLTEIVLNKQRPVQFVIAGKAHPNNVDGKKVMQDLVLFADQEGIREHFLFLPNYDLNLASYLVSGADIWLNNPVRPQEASGTSGMKAVMNGGLTLSISDGWWDEMPQAETGWTIPTVETSDFDYRNNVEAQALYDLLENDIVPSFYERDEHGIPRGWLAQIRRSWTILSPKVTAFRMFRDYTDSYYRPAEHQGQLISRDEDAQAYSAWQERIHQNWSELKLSDLQINHAAFGDTAQAYTSTEVELSVRADLEPLTAEDVRVQAVYGPMNQDGSVTVTKTVDLAATGNNRYAVTLSIDEPGEYGYTVRIVPHHPLLVNPAETGLITYYS